MPKYIDQEATLALVAKGYCETNRLTNHQKAFLFEHFEEATIEHFVGSTSAGGSKFSTYELVGQQVGMLSFLVGDRAKFTKQISSELEAKFSELHPIPDRGVRSAFTWLMHQNNLHWSRCCQGAIYTKNAIGVSDENIARIKSLSSIRRENRRAVLDEILTEYFAKLDKSQEVS